MLPPARELTPTPEGRQPGPVRRGRAATRMRYGRELPAVMRERFVRLRHAVDVLFALVSAALLGLGVEKLAGEALRHRLLATCTRELDEPAHGERAGAACRYLHRHLVGGAADSAGAHLEVGSERGDRLLERLDRLLVRAPGE